MLLRNTGLISNSLLKNTLQRDIIVYRKEYYTESLSQPINKFLSTSVTSRGVLAGTPNVAIIVPKGTPGAYIEPLSFEDYKKQREFLFNSGLTLEKVSDNKGIVVYKVRGENNETK